MKRYKAKLNQIIFGTSTFGGKLFDILLLFAIVLSILTILLETVEPLNLKYGPIFKIADWIFTGIFTIEYALRLYCSPKKLRYIFSFSGIIDFVSIIPPYTGLLFNEARYLTIIRSIRLLRVFRILKLSRFIDEESKLAKALIASRLKITIFISVVTIIVTLTGTLLYHIESPESGFTSIPKSIYWSIVTLTTVGYGDIAPQTAIGQAVSAIIMLLGYSIIVVPTGIVTAEAIKQERRTLPCCPYCRCEENPIRARYCCFCGKELPL